MAKYRVYGVVTATKYIGEFEADTKAEAEKMAWESDEAGVSVCWHCSKEVEDPEIHEIVVEEEV
ncbi:hypothetical protein NKT34_13765 [Paenibacillus polysaccharolyticus]|uniref:hypothetical protein n=1 Tax=Paenibacillus polysaccharolyticus TaxID=582692 RepID=UPI0020A1848B|nr:hypothetical protein [Paenibacillus polysaccharolyticus]MCP1134367.1 hypothetical protein [Paenibacillus polysaccharolyticus]